MSANEDESVTLMAADSPDRLGPAFVGWLGYARPRVLLLMTSTTLAYRIYLGEFGAWDLALVAAIVLWWPIQEWLIHTFILHFRPLKVAGRTIDLLNAKKHRAHHRDPWRIPIIFVPLHTYFYAVPLLFLLWVGLAPTLPLAFTGLLTFFGLSLHYEWVHYIVHTRVKPKTWYYQRLWRNHRLHHCKNEQYWMGVSMLAGDRIFGTAKAPQEVPTSDTCRTLGVESTLGA